VEAEKIIKRITMKLTEQSELKMETAGCRPVSRRYRRISQANWWFGQMRRAVEQACPSETGPARRGEQKVLPLN
jgi:hypothetical protein